MTIRTALTDAFGLEYPIVLAPMGGIAGGRLAAAVSNAGGLGLVGGGYGDPAWLRTELDLVRASTERPWGVGLITWHASREVVDLALRYQLAAFLLSFGDTRPYAPAIKAAGCALVCQVQDVEAAREAIAAGADLLVAQGAEAGGHGATRATFPLVPAVVDAVAPVPVLAAGGIADGRGLAAALMLGAQGAMIGTRFYAAVESLGHERARARIVAARAGDTARTRVFDIVRGYPWPEPYTGQQVGIALRPVQQRAVGLQQRRRHYAQQALAGQRLHLAQATQQLLVVVLDGRRMSPVMTSSASWNSASVTTRSAGTSRPNTARPMVHGACASSATWKECSATLSGTALRIKLQRWMKRSRYR